MGLNRIFGYILILAGLAVIVFTVYHSYNIFTAKIEVPQIFLPAGKISGQSSGNGAQNQMQDAIQKQLGNILPTNSISELLNLISWSILAGILILGGGQISSIGIKLATRKEEKPAE